MAKRRIGGTHQPVCIHGKVVFEFFGNTDEQFKQSEINRLLKLLRKEFQVSACQVEDQLVENPEHAVVVLALVGQTIDQARRFQDEILKFLDGKAPARIVDEDFQVTEL